MGAVAAAVVGFTILAGSAEAHAKKTVRATKLHVDIREDRGDVVSVTVPISIARAALSFSGNGTVNIDDGDVDVDGLREMWDEIKKTGETEIVRVDDGDDRIRVVRDGGEVRVEVDEGNRSRGKGRVRIRMPEDAIDALLSGDSLDVGAAMDALREDWRGDLITIDDGDDHVRIWIE